MSLPKGYVPLEYIQSSGTQHIDALFEPNQNTRLVLDFESGDIPSSYSSGFAALFGARDGPSSKAFSVWLQAASVYPQYGSVSYSANGYIGVDIKQRLAYDFNKNVFGLAGKTIKCANAEFSTSYSLCLLGINSGGTVDSRKAIGKLYSCQIYDNGLLVRDYIPAKTIEGEIGLYDRVFKEFYRNAGTGEFVAGPEMVHEDYTELEYIESSGSQCADTGFVPDSNTRVVAEMEVTAAATSFLFGSRTNSSANSTSASFSMVQISGTSLRSDYGSAENAVALSPLQKLSIDKNKASTTVNGVATTATAQTFSGAYSLVLFAVNTAGTIFATKTAAKLYVFQVYDNGTEVRAYIPMLHPSGVAGLWDTVNKRFYASATTTDFVAGPEAVKAPKAPGNFRIVSESDTEVTLVWDASKNATGYLVRQSEMVVADTTELSVTAEIQPFGYYTFEVSAYNEVGEGERSTLAVFRTPDNPMLWLVTDRTAQDVAALNNKGVYQTADLNRVGATVGFLKRLLESAGFAVNVSARVWSDLEWVNISEAAQYLANIQELRSKQAVLPTTPETPDTLAQLNHTRANHIEQILLDVYTQYLIMLTTRVAAGTATSGGDYL